MSDTTKVFIEIPEGSAVKYEIDNETGELVVDRVMPTAMRFPVNYGSINCTKGGDGDPLDALVFTSQPIVPGAVITCNILGVLEMEDEKGIDHKIVCVPVEKIDFVCGAWKSLNDIPTHRKDQIRHFFEHYKDLEKGKWVKLKGWKEAKIAKEILNKGTLLYEKEGGADHDCICGGHCGHHGEHHEH